MASVHRAWLAALLLVGIGLTRCVVENGLDDRLWPCDVDSTVDQCGTKDGRSMICWQGYCMSSCDLHAPKVANHECIEPGVLLETCQPTDDHCPGELNCYRTSLVLNKGLCVPFRTCTTNQDCARAGDVCAGEVLRERMGEAGEDASTDHFQCVSSRCSQGSPCDADETCLDASYNVDGRYPDICVPNCDQDQRCMPNFACAKSAAAPGADPVCIPGLPGMRCTDPHDCVVGDCVPLDTGFSICTIPCTSDEECERIASPPTYFFCAGGKENGEKYCVHPSPLSGSECRTDPDTDEPQCSENSPLCTNYSPYGPVQGFGECRVPCGEDRSCPVRAGIPHVCLGKDREGGCFPGLFAIACEKEGDCARPFKCEPVEPDGREFDPSPSICTIRCASDADCDAVRATGMSGYCGGGYCRRPGLAGRPCERNEHCSTGHCLVQEGVCAPLVP